MELHSGWKELLPLLVFMAIMLLMFWYIVVVPTKKRQKSHQDLLAALSEGDQIVTVGGIYGKIVKLREDTMDLEVASGVRIKLDRRAVRRRVQDKDAGR